jgi:hypothetical protein
MKRLLLAACVAALGACNQPAATTEEAAPAAPQSLMDQVDAMGVEQQPVFAYQQLVAYQQAHAEAQPPCASIRRAESLGVIPDNVVADSIYAAYKGSHVFSVQCGPQLTTVRDDPREHWLVIFAPGAMEAAVVNCANPRGDSCPRVVATETPAPAAP